MRTLRAWRILEVDCSAARSPNLRALVVFAQAPEVVPEASTEMRTRWPGVSENKRARAESPIALRQRRPHPP